MRFDLEIPTTNIDIAYIPEGNKIPLGLVPLDYVHMDHKNYVPRDFISADENAITEEFFGVGAEEQTGPSFLVKGNKFQITHIAKYSILQNIKIPMFYKHLIVHSLDEKINEDSIRIVNYYDEEINKDYYLVEQTYDSLSSKYVTTIYINKSSEILFVEYILGNKICKKLLNLEPIFKEVGWETMVFSDEDIPKFLYIIQGNLLKTAHNGTLYIQYDYQRRLLRRPIANIEDNWYISVLNTEWYIEKENVQYKYSIPEYYMKLSAEDARFVKLKNKKCKVLFDNYIQLQSELDPERLNEIEIYVRNFYTNELRVIATTNKLKNGELYENKVFRLIEDVNSAGIVKLPFELLETDVVYASFPIIEDFYEFKFFDFNSDIMNGGGHVAIYVLPDVGEAELAVFYAMIGDRKSSVDQKTGKQGLIFETTTEYFDFIDRNNCYHVATIKVASRKEADIVKVIDVRMPGGELINKKEACETTANMFLTDLKNETLTIPTQDTLVATIDAEALARKGLLTINNETLEIPDSSMRYLEKLHEVIASNLDISSRVILELDKNIRTKIKTIEPTYVGLRTEDGKLILSEVLDSLYI